MKIPSLFRWKYVVTLLACCVVAGALAADPGERTRALTTVVQSDTSLFEKARACQQLGEIGTSDAVTVLAKLLDDPKLSAFARSGLEGIHDASAAAVLREATTRVRGALLAGVVNSLGTLRDPQAVGMLTKLAKDAGAGVSREAYLALGNISTPESIRVLREALAGETGSERDPIAHALLLAADQQRAGGNLESARALFDAVRSPSFPMPVRVGATRGAILVRGDDQVDFLMEQVRSDERPIRNAALLTMRDIRDEAVASALNAAVRTASTDLQEQLLQALADRHNDASIAVIAELTESPTPVIRRTALTILGQLGAKAAPALLEALQKSRSSDERTTALNALRTMPGSPVDELLRQSLRSAIAPALRIDLIQLMEARFVTQAAPDLMPHAVGADRPVSVAALSALRILGNPEQVQGLIALGRSTGDEELKDSLEEALSGICRRSGHASCQAVLAALEGAADTTERNRWIRVLARGGCPDALPAIEKAAGDPDPVVADNALAELGRWPDPAPVPVLLRAMESAATPSLRQRALNSLLDLAAAAVDEASVTPSEAIAWLHRTVSFARSTPTKVRVLGILARVPAPEAFQILRSFLNDPGVINEAASALLQIAPSLARSEEADAVRNALESVAATSPDFRERALRAAQSIPKGAPIVRLFDGQSLRGWEGDLNVWRVRDGVIVGGNMNGNPRNEFLATVRPYTNFILRLEYKLVGTEGFVNSGVQFQSVRIDNPPNEMRGYQADIGAGFSGVLYDESRRNMILSRVSEATIKKIERVGEWNRYEIQCEGRHIQLRLNGEKTVDYTELDTSLPLSGLIGLQIHGGNKAEVSFRNLTVQEF